MERPDSMKASIEKDEAHARLGPDERKAICEFLKHHMVTEIDIDEALDVAAEWVERYLLSDERARRPPPSFEEQAKTRRRLRPAIRKLRAEMKGADRETRKRVYHHLADRSDLGLTDRQWHEDSFDHGQRLFWTVRSELKLLAKAVDESKRIDDPKGQADPATYLLYRTVLIWQHVTGLEFSMSEIPNGGKPTAIGFFNVLLDAAAVSATMGEQKKLNDLQKWRGKSLKSALTAVFRKIDRGDPERGNQTPKERARSDSDQDRPDQAVSDSDEA